MRPLLCVLILILTLPLGCGTAAVEAAEACSDVACPSGTSPMLNAEAESACSGGANGTQNLDSVGVSANASCVGSGACSLICVPVATCCGGESWSGGTYTCEVPCASTCSCAGKCGTVSGPGCEAECGGCGGGQICSDNNVCVDGCEGDVVSCGGGCCATDETCYQNACCDPVANCVGKACGTDGCGGSCEDQPSVPGCEAGTTCKDGQCVATCGGSLPVCSTIGTDEKILSCSADGIWVDAQNCALDPSAPYCEETSTGAKCVPCSEDSHCDSGLFCMLLADTTECVTCTDDAHCPSGQSCDAGTCIDTPCVPACTGDDLCVAGECTPPLCTPGETFCDGNDLATCNDDALSVSTVACDSDQVCDAAACIDVVCEPGATICNGQAVETCNELGTAHAPTLTCSSTQSCLEGACVNHICVPGDASCSDNAVATCNPDALSYSTVDCAADEVCDAAQCLQVVCEAGALFCDEQFVKACNDLGTSSSVQSACGLTQTCVDGVCLDHICTPGVAECFGNAIKTCNPDALSTETTPCNAEQVCVDAVCLEEICTPDEMTCEDGNVTQCNEHGTAWVAHATCTDTQTCVAGACEDHICVPGSAACTSDNGAVETCLTSGLETEVTTCAGATSICEDAECKPVVCSANTLYCEGQAVMQCNANGTEGSVSETCDTPSEVCVNGSCLDKICEPGATLCNGMYQVQVCVEPGTSYDSTPCEAQHACSDGACQEQLCTPGAVFCSGTQVQTCGALGLSTTVDEDCGVAGQICVDAACAVQICTPNTSFCDEQVVMVCNEHGTESFSLGACEPDEFCEEGAGTALCQPQICTPEETYCDGATVRLCNTEGSDGIFAQDCGSAGQLCFAGGCADLDCAPDTSFCEDNAVMLCDEVGSGSTEIETCGADEYCHAGADATLCMEQLCTPGETYCDGETVKLCNDEGSDGSLAQDCAAADQACVGGVCTEMVCVPDSTFCVGDVVYVCSANGTTSDVQDTCSDTEFCEESGDTASCQGELCIPDATFCEGDVLMACNTNGSAATQETDCAAVTSNCAFPGLSMECSAGACVEPACMPSCEGLESYGGHWYCPVTVSATWADAVENCANMGLSLVQPDDAGEEAFVLGLLGSSGNIVCWTSLKKDELEGKYAPWADSKPDGNGDCVLARTIGWSNEYCDDTDHKYKYVCEDSGELCEDGTCTNPPADGDGDGVTVEDGDCDDADPSVYPFAGDVFGDDIDGDCDGVNAQAGMVDSRYVVLSGPVSWLDAEATCASWGYQFGSVQSDTENAGIVELFESSTLPSVGDVSTYIAINYSCDGDWSWGDGYTGSYTHWDGDQPHGCEYAYIDVETPSAGWVATGAGEVITILCVADTSPGSCPDGGGPGAGDTSGDGVDSDCDGLDCEAGVFRGSYFAACPDQVDYADAVSQCSAAGYTLASIHSADEQDHAFSLMTSGGMVSTHALWIGYSDAASEGTWLWEDGSASIYENWLDGVFSNNADEEDCAVMNGEVDDVVETGGWNTLPCDITGDFVGQANWPHGYLCRAYPASCQAVLEAGETEDGTYWIDPDGEGGNAAFEVYCDMTTDGGGWTLVARGLKDEPGANAPSNNPPYDDLNPWNQDEALNASNSGGMDATWHLSSATINSIASGGDFRADCPDVSGSKYYWSGVSGYSWSTCPTNASECNGTYGETTGENGFVGCSSYSQADPPGCMGLCGCGMTTSHQMYPAIGSPWYCGGSHTIDFELWAK